MTSTQSLNKRKNPTFTWFKQQASKSLVYGILIAVAIFFVNFLLVFHIKQYAENDMSNMSYGQFADYAAGLYTVLLLVCDILALAVLVRNFRHLYKKSIADTVYALPISNNQRFIGSLLASLFMIVIPVLIAIALSIGYYSLATDATKYFDELLVNSNITDSDFVWLFANLGFAQLANMLFAFATALFVFCCCGTLFDSALYSFALSIVGFVFYLMTSFATSGCGNYYWSYSDQKTSILHYISPISAPFMNVYSRELVDTSSTVSSYDYKVVKDDFASYYLIIFAIAIVLTVLSFILHSRRKSEHVGKPFAYKPFYYIISTVVFLLSGFLFYNSYISSLVEGYNTYYHGAMIAIVIIAFFAFALVETLAERKKRPSKMRIVQGAVRFVAIFIVSVALSSLSAKYGVNKVYKEPVDTENVKFVSLNIWMQFEDAEYDEYGNIAGQSPICSGVSYTDKEVIEKLASVCDDFNSIIYKKYQSDGYKGLLNNGLGSGNECRNGVDFYNVEIYFAYKDGTTKVYYYDCTVSDKVADWAFEAIDDEFYLSRIEDYDDADYDSYAIAD